MYIMTVKEEYTLAIATSLINKFQNSCTDPIDWMDSINWDEFFKRVETITSILLFNINKNIVKPEEVELHKNEFIKNIEDYLELRKNKETGLVQLSAVNNFNRHIHLDADTVIDIDKDGCIILVLTAEEIHSQKL